MLSWLPHAYSRPLSPAPSPSSIRHRLLLPLSGGVACALKTRLRKLRPGRASYLPTAAPPVCSQRCGSSGISTTSLRPCHGRPCNSALAASTTTCWLQGGCHGVSGPTWSCATIPESAGSCRRPAQPLPTLVSFVTPTARATIPANKCRSTDISSCCITPLELNVIRHSSIFISVCLPSTSQNISFPPVFSWHYLITIHPRGRGLCNSFAILATLQIFDWHWHCHWLFLIKMPEWPSFGVLSGFISRSVHARLQVSVCIVQRLWFVPPWLASHYITLKLFIVA